MAERVDRTNGELAAEREAFVELGEAGYRRFGSAVRVGGSGRRFGSAVRAYVLAVDAAEYARQEWERLERPMRDTFANGMAGIHPVLKAWEQAATQAARFAGELGLTPMSAARLGRLGVRRGPGRPVGANSAPDRVALPAAEWNGRPGAPLKLAGGLPPPLPKIAAGDAASVNRARGHGVD